MEGTVEFKGLAKPVDLNPEYRNLCKDRVTKANTKTRFILPIDNKNAPTTRRPVDTIFTKPKKKIDGPTRRADERLEKTQLMEKIFRTFESSSYLTIKNLQESTHQPVVSIPTLPSPPPSPP
jgi:predicted transcriptional regulator